MRGRAPARPVACGRRDPFDAGGSPAAAPEYVARVPRRPYTDEQIDAAVAAISKPEAFREAERAVARAAPQLQKVLAEALGAGGWFGESHEGEVLKAATTPD